jgi:hypothetical protein
LTAALGNDAADLEDLLEVGAIHLTVDGLNEVGPDERQIIADWITNLVDRFARLRVLVCHRQFSYRNELLPFPVARLQKVARGEAERYIAKVFRDPELRPSGERLIKLLLEKEVPKEIADLAQSPLFLWMIVELYGGQRRAV